jgi:hypothetical protein
VDTDRPTLRQWLIYVYTGRAPARCRDWVLRDTTANTWVLRHAGRFLVQLTPLIVAVLVFLPAPLWIRFAAVVAGIASSVVFSFGYTVEGAERRVEKAGYLYGTAERTRETRSVHDQREASARRRQKIADRRERRAI